MTNTKEAYKHCRFESCLPRFESKRDVTGLWRNGRRARLRTGFLLECGFDSLQPHQTNAGTRRDSSERRALWRVAHGGNPVRKTGALASQLLHSLPLWEDTNEAYKQGGSIPSLATTCPALWVSRLGSKPDCCQVRFLGGVPHGQIAQLVEQWTENPRVAGSIPALATFYFGMGFQPSRPRVLGLTNTRSFRGAAPGLKRTEKYPIISRGWLFRGSK